MKGEKSNRGCKGYPPEFKQKVIDDLLFTGSQVSDLAKRYGMNSRTIYNWLRTFGIAAPSKEQTISMTDKGLYEENAELKRENARLKAALFHAEADALAHKTLLEVVTKRHHIEIKKTDLQQ